ncbi:hypothetical protein ACIQAC_14255 [Streptomyces sp. NPDC088387]|uniref:hypothetical protein n=1 Tax=Streptomyces sp. NPDC088387 TaxID=3365859 RepID=UPI003820F321
MRHRPNSRRTLALSCAALALAALPGCRTQNAGVEFAPATEPSEQCVGSRPAGSLPGRDAADAEGDPAFPTYVHIDTTLRERHSDVYTGVEAGDDVTVLDVYRIPSAAFDKDVCGSAEKGVTVRLHNTDINRERLEALAERVTDESDRWESTFRIASIGADAKGYVLVGVDEPHLALPVLEREFGAGHIRVEREERASLLTG